MNRPGRTNEILLEPPLARHTDVVPAVEDRSYLLFIGGAMAMAVFAGFVLAVVASLSASSVLLEERLPWLIQAHGWAQLQGWAGLFVAGMGLRVLPRFAGRRPISRKLSLAVFVLLFAGVVARTSAQAVASGAVASAGLLVGQLLWSAGASVFGLMVIGVLVRGRGRGQSWHALALAGAAWWLAWSIAAVVAGIKATSHDGFVPYLFDDSMAWAVMLGSIGNFTWAIQSRSVPVFFGRKPPTLRRIALPASLLNGGTLLVFVAGWLDFSTSVARISGAGFCAAGIGLVLIAPVAGSCWGTATRLRPRARSAARFVLVANNAAVLCGMFLAWAGASTLVDGELAAQGARDAARHVFGLGVITMLIIGMAQLIAPFFALRRVESRSASLADNAVFWLLAIALVSRAGSGLLVDHAPHDVRMHISATAGTLAWLALVLFAGIALRAVRSEPRIKAGIAVAAGQGAAKP